MNRLIIIVWLGLFFGFSANAQNSGYCGKHFSLFYNLYTMQAFRGPTPAGGSGPLSFNLAHNLTLEAAVARRLSLGLAFEYFHTGFDFDKGFRTDCWILDNSGHLVETEQIVSSHDIGIINSYTLGFQAKIYTRSSIAPLGTYIRPGFFVHMGFPDTKNVEFYIVQGSTECQRVEIKDRSPYFAYSISFEVGQNRLFFDRLFIDYGFRLALSPSIVKYGRYTSLTDNTCLDYYYNNRIANMMNFNLKVGVGVLLF